MKKIYIPLLCFLALISCRNDDNGGNVSSEEEEEDEIVISIPQLVYPTDHLICTNYELTLEWNAAKNTSNTGALSYVIEISDESDFSMVLFSKVTSSTHASFTLEKGVSYYWRVKARDAGGNEGVYTDTREFYTEPNAGINTVPTIPTLVSPEWGSAISGNNITLHWNASDHDGDSLSYDLYFGETSPPDLVTENLENSTVTVSVSSGKTYFWRVVAKDPDEGVAISQVWNFVTTE